MRESEYDCMARVERDHWWYRGFRDAVAHHLRCRAARLPDRPRVLDAGCGTGENLRLLRDLLRPSELYGFDISPRAVAYAQVKVPEARVVVEDLTAPGPDRRDVDVILCADVIYMTEATATLPALRQLLEQLAQGGYFFLHVPAYQWLYSQHDTCVGTQQRFCRRQVREMLTELGLSLEFLSYRMALLFPAVVLARLPSLLRRRKAVPETSTSELAMPPRWLDWALRRVLDFENWLMARGVRFAWGSSILAVGRKP